jgi:hypothetical protein
MQVSERASGTSVVRSLLRHDETRIIVNLAGAFAP